MPVEHLAKRSGVSCPKESKLKTFKPILQSWIELQTRYAKFESEAAFDYTEAANSSLLVSAANSLNNWIGISEHGILRKRKKTGRCDVYLADKKYGYFIEMKQIWPSRKQIKDGELSKGNRDIVKVAKKQILDQKKEYEDLKEISGAYGCFLVPEFPVSSSKDETLTDLKSTIQIAKKEFHLVAWCFPDLKTQEVTMANGKRRPFVVMGLNHAF